MTILTNNIKFDDHRVIVPRLCRNKLQISVHLCQGREPLDVMFINIKENSDVVPKRG